MKKMFEPMAVSFVGALNNVVNKSGAFCDLSQNFETKSPDDGGGQEEQGPCPA